MAKVETMSIIIRMQNLPWSVDAQGIRQFFHGLSIPDGGVHIIGGENGDAFITFSTDEDARRAMMKDRNRIENIPIRLFLSSKTELYDVTVATYGTLLPLMGYTLTGQFSHLTEQSTHGSGLIGQRSPTIPIMGNSYPPDWPQDIVHPLLGISVTEPQRVADIGIRPPLNKLVFSERISSDAVIGSSSAENSLQMFSVEHGQLGGNKSSSLEISGRQKSVEKRGNLSCRMDEESAAKIMRLQNHESQDEFDRASLLKEFSKLNGGLYQCMKKLSEHSDAGQPALGQEFLMMRTGSEFTSRDIGYEFGHPELGKEGLVHDINRVSHEELIRNIHDVGVSCWNENKSRTIESLFTGDVSCIAPSGARESRAIGNGDSRLLRMNTVPRSDLKPSFPELEFIHSVLSQGLELGLLNDIRLSTTGSSLGARSDNHRFGNSQGEQRLNGEFPTFGHNERQFQISRNIRDENPSSGELDAPGNYSEMPREFLDWLANVVPDAKGRVGKRQPCDISRNDIFSLRGGCGLWICVSNFPLSYSYREFRDFFSGHGIPIIGLKLVTDGFGKPGLAYIKFNSWQATVESLKLDGRVVDGCRVAVERCSEAEYEDAIDNHELLICKDQGRSRPRSPIEQHILPNKEKVCVVVKNLSSETTTKDIREYFDNSIIAENGGPFLEFDSDGQPKHMALVQFNSDRDFEAAFLNYRRCRLLNGATVRVVGIKMDEFLQRLQRSRISRIEKNVAPGKPRATSRSAKRKTKKLWWRHKAYYNCQ